MCDKSLAELNQLLDDLDAQIDQAYADGRTEFAIQLEDEYIFIELHIEQEHVMP